jgi:hypothetical protein
VLVEEVGGAVDEVDLVALEVGADALVLGVGHRLLARHQLRHRDLVLERELQAAVHLALPVARQEEGGLAQGLGGNSAGVDAGAAGIGALLDDGYAFAEIGGLDSAFFTGGAGANDEPVVIAHTPQCNARSVTS